MRMGSRAGRRLASISLARKGRPAGFPPVFCLFPAMTVTPPARRGRKPKEGMFAKVFSSLWDGTLGHQLDVWPLFVFMLAHCDQDGNLDMTPEAISARSHIPLDAVLRGIAVLEALDPRSRSQVEDGRRILRIDEHRDWGWHIVNYEHYRGLRDNQERRAQTRKAVSAHRAKVKATVSHGKPDVSHGKPRKAQGEGEGEVDTESQNTCRWRDAFAAFWQEYPHFHRRSAKQPSLNLWMRIAVRTPETLACIMHGLSADKRSPDWQREGGAFVPGAQVWLKRSGWDASAGVAGEAEGEWPGIRFVQAGEPGGPPLREVKHA